MSIFESLENLNISEECFDEIMDIVEKLLINEKVTVSKWVEAANKALGPREDKMSQELIKNVFKKENNGDEAHNAVHRLAHAKAVSKLAPSDDNAQDVRQIHRAAIQPLRKKVDRALKAGKSAWDEKGRLEKALSFFKSQIHRVRRL